ncbi:MAG: RHS repeat domain-containing protein [Sedimenticola sp.]
MTRKPGRIINLLLLALVAACSLWLPTLSYGAGYDYDELGRLIRYVDKNGQVTHYNYDPVGNLLGVDNTGLVTPPVIDTLSTVDMRCGETTQVSIQGGGLEGIRVTPSVPGVQISEIVSSANEVTFTIKVEDCSLVGTHTLGFHTAGGRIDLNLTIDPLLPEVYITPAPLAIPPDGSQRAFALQLTHADTLPHTFTLSVSDPTVVNLMQESLTIPAGGREVRGALAGLKAGQTILTLDSPTLGTTAVPLFVLADFVGVNTSYGHIYEVVKERLPGPLPSFTVSGMPAPQVGVVLGNGIEGLNPNRITTGTGPLPLEINGVGLSGVTNIAIQPPDGVTLGTFTLATDGRSAVVPVTVAESAPTTMRRVVLSSSGGGILPVRPEADRLRIVPPKPEIHSIAPLILKPGDIGKHLTIRGARLQNAREVQVLPGDGISIGTPTVNAAGTLLSTTISLSPAAALGERQVVVVTNGGPSDETPSPANTLHIVLEAGENITSLTAPMVGVVKESAQTPQQSAYTFYGTQLGVVKGSLVKRLDPSAGIVGQNYLLTIEGAGLTGADSVAFEPATGITVTNPPTVTADGRSLSVNIAIAANAPKTIRRVDVLQVGAVIPSATESTNRFRVTPPPPEIDSVTPLILTTGTTAATLTLRGHFFDNARPLRLLPESGITIGSTTVHDGGSRLTAQVNVDTGAPTGPRMIQVATPGGESSALPGAENSITIVTQAGPTYRALTASVVGVTKQLVQPHSDRAVTTHSPVLGVVVTEVEQPVSTTLQLSTPQLGVVHGQVAKTVAPSALLRGTSSTLTVTGEYLQDVIQVELQPADGVIVGNTVTTAADGSSLSVPIDIDPAAAPGARKVMLRTALGVVPFSRANAARFTVGHDTPEILSIEPILAGRGEVFTLLVRGTNLFNPKAVMAEPPEGMLFGNSPQGNAAGTEVRVQVAIQADALLGTRVIRVAVPGAVTSPQAEPANSFTIYETVPN